MNPDIKVESFGERLRRLRRQGSLSQATVGGSKYSASYISHLESGRRRPTEDVVVFLADQLGVRARDLQDTDHRSYTSGSPELDLLELQAGISDAQANGDQVLVCERAERIADLAATERRADVWWSATQCRMQALMKLNRSRAAIAVGEELLANRITSESARLQSEILTAMARCYRRLGELDISLELSQRATVVAREAIEEHPDCLAQALVQHVSTQLSAGSFLAAEPWEQELRQLRTKVTSPQILGLIAWILGNAAFLADDVELGTQEHDLARSLLSAEVDLQAWGRFRQASARMQLEVGISAGIEDLIESAATALSLAGDAGDMANQAMIRALHLAEHGEHGAALGMLDQVLSEPNALSGQAAGEVQELRHRSLLALGQVCQAREALKLAAHEYEGAQAWARALKLWRTYADLESSATSASSNWALSRRQ